MDVDDVDGFYFDDVDGFDFDSSQGNRSQSSSQNSSNSFSNSSFLVDPLVHKPEDNIWKAGDKCPRCVSGKVVQKKRNCPPYITFWACSKFLERENCTWTWSKTRERYRFDNKGRRYEKTFTPVEKGKVVSCCLVVLVVVSSCCSSLVHFTFVCLVVVLLWFYCFGLL